MYEAVYVHRSWKDGEIAGWEKGDSWKGNRGEAMWTECYLSETEHCGTDAVETMATQSQMGIN